MALAVGLWATDAIPLAVTGIASVVLLTLVGAVPDITAALYGFSQPVPYFLIGILTLGLGVQQSGLANRMAGYLIRLSRGSPRALYAQMLLAFAALTFALPSASTRGAILVHVYEEVMGAGEHSKRAPAEQGGDDGHGVAQPPRLHGAAGRRNHAGGGVGPHRRFFMDQMVRSDGPFLSGSSWWWGGVAIFLLYRPGSRSSQRPPTGQTGTLGRERSLPRR